MGILSRGGKRIFVSELIKVASSWGIVTSMFLLDLTPSFLRVTFALGDWNYFPFNLVCIQSQAQGHFGFLSAVWLPHNIIW